MPGATLAMTICHASKNQFNRVAFALSDLSGVSGQAIIRALLAGERDPKVLAQLRDSRCQASEEEMVQSSMVLGSQADPERIISHPGH